MRWRKVNGWPYEVSETGRVRRIDTGRELKGTRVRSGHRVVALQLHGYRETTGIHRLVLAAFDRPSKPGEQCRHLNGVPDDNRLENLAWGSALENQRDRKEHGTDPKGERNGNAKLTASQARAIFVDSRAQTVIATEYGVTQALVGMIKRREVWEDETTGLKAGRKNAAILTQAQGERILTLKAEGLSGRKIAAAMGLKSGQVFAFLAKQ